MDMDRYIGRLLDNRYEILEVIGIGGMAVVYKARCHRLNRLVAVKILKDDYSQDEEFRNRFHAESQAVAMLGHPNIVSVYDVSSTGAADYIVMELIEGISLKQYMEKKGVLNWKETLHFGMQIAKALEHAHSRGIVHRDIKPHNVMVLKNGSVKVADFGIARLMSKGNTLTKEALGSVHYISPEQAKGGRVDNRSDIYSLGVVMYEMMTGRPPYDGESPVAVAIQHINGGAPMPSTLNTNIPGGLEQIIMKAMALDFNDRYTSATQMLADMEEFRKDPAILFDYYRDAVDGTVHLHVLPVGEQEEKKIPLPGRTTAERMAGSSPRRNQRPAGDELRRKPAEPPRQRQQEELEEDHSRVTTIAVVACSVVAVIAIIIFIITIFGKDWTSKPETVPLPNLIGEYYEDVKDQRDLELVLQERVYNEEHEEGVIIDQKPTFEGQQVALGTKVYLTVSSGPEPLVKVMEDLVGLDQSYAENFLNNQKLDLQILIRPEKHDTVEAGRVIRTDPELDTKLEKGQTVVLWVSEGPDIQTAKMPNVLGRDIETALSILNAAGFKNIETKEVESEKTAGVVLTQSEEKNTDVDVTTKIFLEYSKGSQVKRVRMPSVLGQNLSTAIGVLKANGFTNIKYQAVPSNEDKDTVVKQSVPENFEVEVTAEIILEYSEGPEETTVPSASEDSGNAGLEVTVQHPLPLPTGMTEPYVLHLKQNGVDVLDPYHVTDPTQTELVVSLTGSGVETYEVWANDAFQYEVKVDFIPYG